MGKPNKILCSPFQWPLILHDLGLPLEMQLRLIWILGLLVFYVWGESVKAQFLPDPPDTPEYRKAALEFLLREANQVAGALDLPEKLPITEQDLSERFICSPKIAQGIRAIGTITTSNYVYCVSRDNKFSYVIDPNQEQKIMAWEKSYSWPTDRIEKIGPYIQATQWLAQASMDVDALNRDYLVAVKAEIVYERENRFVPVYTVFWFKGHPSDESVASVRLFLPTKTLMQLRVEDPKYIVRPRFVSTNIAESLSISNASSFPQPPR